MDIPSDVYDVFIRSCFEQLADIETRILDLEQNTDDTAGAASLWDAIIRPAHSIKADAASIGLNALVDLAHAMESAIIRCRDNHEPLSRQTADILLSHFDRLRHLIRTGKDDPNADVSDDVLCLNKIGVFDDFRDEELTKQAEEPIVDQGNQRIDWMHVPAEKMDILVDYVGEMLVLNSRLGGLANQAGLADLSIVAEQIESLGGVIRDQVMDIRLMPVGTVFSRFRRMVRDLASRLGKRVQLEMVGEDTELDKTVIEQVCPLLAHLLRNAVDHGIEEPNKRLAAGKSEVGTIHLQTAQEGGDVVLTVSDDGAGVDMEALAQKAIMLGHSLPAQQDSDGMDLVNLMFLPGVTQSVVANDVSGRGMGMSAVMQTVHNLRGSITVNTTPGKGVVFTLRIPLSMTLFLGLEVQCADSRFLLHMESIIECWEIFGKDFDENRGSIFNYRGTALPLVSLRRFFQLDGEALQPNQVVIVEAADSRYAVVVDSIIGQKKAVFQKLSPALGRVDGVSGMSLTGDGNIALILDIARIAEIVAGPSTKTHDR
ncbi:chemotaxis protein CheA [Desulfovibrio inopinatus]|uniref:chemotaxis protein CheA n=1 Tax=Desulfovibrio inopinatus TaxID=102109 RepID=UPI00040F6473|nr:chemotaxis protein CheW [Desulfovibrio inopinatus]